MSNVDIAAVERNIAYINKLLRELKHNIDLAQLGKYSPLMSYEHFEEVCAQALAEMGAAREDVCFGLKSAHRCSRCESLVQAFMNLKCKV